MNKPRIATRAGVLLHRRFLNSILTIVITGLVVPVLLGQGSMAQTVKDVYTFSSDNSSQHPDYVTLVQGRDGRLYGTTRGEDTAGTIGSVFNLSTVGSFNELFVFEVTEVNRGAYPDAGVTLASDGNFYGTTSSGGPDGYDGFGVFFQMTPRGTYTVLSNFDGQGNGGYPTTAPLEASDGRLYGTTRGEGNPDFDINFGATVYRYTPSGVFSTIYQFPVFDEIGLSPLIEGLDGALYGTAFSGGTNGCGIVFKMTTAGRLLRTHSFTCGGYGYSGPSGPLIQAADGNFYGTTAWDGTFNCGTVFRMTPRFGFVVLHSFGGSSDGCIPNGGLVQATDGVLYGTTEETIFRISTSGIVETLYRFDGEYPGAGPMQHTNGLFYGTVSQGGAYNFGLVYSLDMGLGPFITFVRANGKVGQTAQILGQGLTGTTNVTFNGVPATSFLVGTDTYIRAVIPSGSTSGPVVVTTPTGTLTSNKDFRVIQ